MKIVVISLSSSQDRRAKVVEKLAGKSIDFEFLDAVDGRNGDHPYLKNYNEKAFLVNRRRKAAPGELGCYVSHLLAWEKCVDLNEAIVVLEDDFELANDFVEGLKFVGQFVDKVAFIRLEPLESNCFVTSIRGQKFSLVKQLKVGMCATGYVITPQGAKAFLEKAQAICYPIDLYLQYTFIHKQLMYAIKPNIVYTTHADSIIGIENRNYREKGVRLKFERFLFKWIFVVVNIITNLINSYTKLLFLVSIFNGYSVSENSLFF